jgi:hypothetical protein
VERSEIHRLRRQRGENPQLLLESENGQPRHNLTIRAWLFEQELRLQCGQNPKNLTSPNQPFLRRQKNSQQLGLSFHDAMRQITGT